MELYIPILIAGFGGGVIRGIVGFIKHQFSYKNTGFIVGYAGGDFIENLYKIILRKTSLFE